MQYLKIQREWGLTFDYNKVKVKVNRIYKVKVTNLLIGLKIVDILQIYKAEDCSFDLLTISKTDVIV